MRLRNIKAQSIMEYAVLVALFITAIVAMQIYLKRSFQGYIKRSTDTLSAGEQFSSSLSNYTKVIKSSSKIKEKITPKGETKAELLEPSISITQTFRDDFSDKKLTEEGLFQ